MVFFGRKLFLVTIALLAFNVQASPPKLSGNYILSMTGSCPVDPDRNSRGELSGNLFQVKVIPNKTGVAGRIIISGYHVNGSLLGGGNPSNFREMQEEPVINQKFTYSNSAKTLRLNSGTGSGSESFHIYYGSVDRRNVAHYAAIMSLADSDTSGVKCITQGTLVKQ